MAAYRTVSVAGVWVGAEGFRVVFDLGAYDRFAVVKLPHNSTRVSVKFWAGTTVDKTASFWNMQKLSPPTLSESSISHMIDEARTALREYVDFIRSRFAGENIYQLYPNVVRRG